MSSETCGARRPGFELRPPIGRNSIPCVLPAGHQGDHENAFGDRWPSAARVRSTEDAALERELEFRCVSRKLEALYARQMAGEDSTLIRQRVKRLEALTAALCGYPGQLSA